MNIGVHNSNELTSDFLNEESKQQTTALSKTFSVFTLHSTGKKFLQETAASFLLINNIYLKGLGCIIAIQIEESLLSKAEG